MWAKINPVITAPIEGAACSMPSPCAPIFRTSLANIGNSAGVEAKKVLKKSYQNEQMIKVSEYLKKAGIPLSINNIIGFPDETRELIFDTIELNRQMNFDTTNAYAFTPFHGTALYAYCLKKGYIEPDALAGCLTKDTVIKMPQLGRDDIRGLMRTFSLYARMPNEYWDKIRVAERFDDEGNKAFKELSAIYKERYFS